MQSNKRKRSASAICVRVDVYEHETLTSNAEAAGLSIASYLRATGLKRRPRSIIDRQHIAEVVKLKADLGRVGGLLKAWVFKEGPRRPEDPERIGDLVSEIEQLTGHIQDVVNRLDPMPPILVDESAGSGASDPGMTPPG